MMMQLAGFVNAVWLVMGAKSVADCGWVSFSRFLQNKGYRA